jgi:hypothetical protein
MSTWHAYSSRPALEPGTEVLVTGGRGAVRLQTADHISIEMTDNNRMSAVVVDCSVDRLLLAVGGGPLVRLNLSNNLDVFADLKLFDGFSRKGWSVR